MKLEELIKQAGNLPVIDTESLMAGKPNSDAMRVQIARWKKAGKLIQLKRGFYLFAEPYRRVNVYEPYIASILKKPSYISLEKALEYHDLIPEAVSVYTSVTTKRPWRFNSEFGIFDYKHIKNSLFWGYESVTINRQTAFMAHPEKALLDLLYLKRVKVSLGYVEELRLQNTEKIDINKLLVYAKRFKKQRLLDAAKMIEGYIKRTKRGEKIL